MMRRVGKSVWFRGVIVPVVVVGGVTAFGLVAADGDAKALTALVCILAVSFVLARAASVGFEDAADRWRESTAQYRRLYRALSAVLDDRPEDGLAILDSAGSGSAGASTFTTASSESSGTGANG